MDDLSSRRISHDFRTFNTDIICFIPTIVDLHSVGEAQGFLHQAIVTTTMDELSHNRVINQHTPQIMKGSYPGLLEPS